MRLQKQFSFKSLDQYQKLIDLAQKHDYKSVSAFVQAIAGGQIFLGRVILSRSEQQTILAAVSALTERACLKSARTLASFALDNLQLEEDVRSQLDVALNALATPWIAQIEEYIEKQQPFGLSYHDAAGRIWTYNVRLGQIIFREKRNYLECWCDETEGNQDLPELRHNWSLRLDRIIDAGIVPINGEWRSGLDTIDVEFELLGGLAHRYTERNSDIQVEWVSLDPSVKRVVRQISNSFWFIREILPYGKDCIVASPEDVRSRVIDQLEGALTNYLEK